MGAKEIQRRRRNLMAKDPHCADCGCEVVYFRRPDGDRTPLPDNFATIEHVNSRIRYPAGRPAHGRQILLCLRCNNARAKAERERIRREANGSAVPGSAYRRRRAAEEELHLAQNVEAFLLIPLDEARRRLGLDVVESTAEGITDNGQVKEAAGREP